MVVVVVVVVLGIVVVIVCPRWCTLLAAVWSTFSAQYSDYIFLSRIRRRCHYGGGVRLSVCGACAFAVLITNIPYIWVARRLMMMVHNLSATNRSAMPAEQQQQPPAEACHCTQRRQTHLIRCLRSIGNTIDGCVGA